MTTLHKNAKQGTGFFLPSYGALKHAQRGAADGDRSCSPDQAAESNPFSVVLERKRQEVLLQQALKNAHCAIPGPFYDQVLVPSASPFCSGSSFAATDGTALSDPYLSEPYPLSPCHSTSSSGSGYWPSEQPNKILPAAGSLASLASPLHYYNMTPALDQHALQEMLLLQQQQAEVDAAINTMLALRQQLAAAAAPAAMPAPAPTAAPLFPGAAPVSRATAALAAQLDMPLYSTPPATAAVAPVSGGSPTAAAQLQLAQLQAEQQQLLDVEQQLQLRLQAEVARLVALG